MKLPSRSLTRCLRMSAILVLGAATAGACPNYAVTNQRFQNCTNVVIYPDSSLSNIPAGTGAGFGGPSVSSQILSAVNAWYTATAAYYPTPNIAMTYPGNEYASNVDVVYAYLGPPFCGNFVGSGTDAGVNTSAVITFDSSGYCTDPSNAAYQNYYLKLRLHELGHLFGLGDVPVNPLTCSQPANQGLSVMVPMCNPDDEGEDAESDFNSGNPDLACRQPRRAC
jgi:hypothetical protein